MQTMDIIEVTLYGTPIAKGRPRFTSRGHTYTDQKTKDAEASILSAWLHVTGNRPPHDGPVTLELTATFVPAPSWPKWKREAALAGDWPHLSKPDIDNLLKIVDGLNGRAWIDDSQIMTAQVVKKYGEIASTHLAITFHPSPTR